MKELMTLHDIIVEELIVNKSLAALIYLICQGRELEFAVEGKVYFISCDKSKKFDRIGELIASTEDMEEFDIPGTEFVENRMPRKSAKYYATEYTVAYDNQI